MKKIIIKRLKIMGKTLAVLTGVVWLGLRQAKKMRRQALIEQIPTWGKD